MNSVRTRLMIIISAVIFGVYLIFAIVSYSDMTGIIEDSAKARLGAATKERAAMIDARLSLVEHVVNRLSDYVKANVDPARMRSDESYRSGLLKDMKTECMDLAQLTDLVGTVYIIPDPELYGKPSCVTLERNEFGGFSTAPVTDILKYDETDWEHVGWYYEPKQKQSKLWVKPYIDKNRNIYMSSFVAPIFMDGEFFGVTGVDLNMEDLHRIMDFSGTDSTFSMLFSSDGQVLYQKDYPVGLPSFQMDGELQKNEDAVADSYEKTGEIIHIVWNGETCHMMATRLKNGMILGILIPQKEVESARVRLWRRQLLILLVVMALVFPVLWYALSKIVRPIRELTDATMHISRGELNIPVTYHSNDEIGELARGIRNVSKEMQEYVTFLHTQAYTDSMTGVGNKQAFQALVPTLDKKIREGLADFAILVFDIDSLKETNEKLGYEYGDLMIADCGRIISETFGSDNVFRYGGDEFLAVVENVPDDELKICLDRIGEQVRLLNLSARSYDRDIVLSAGYAVYTEGSGDTAKDIFQRAYQKMLLSRHHNS